MSPIHSQSNERNGLRDKWVIIAVSSILLTVYMGDEDGAAVVQVSKPD